MSPADPQTKTICGVVVPETPLIDDALSFARQLLPDYLYNHIVRSFLFGFIIAEKLPSLRSRDREAHAIAAILHDLGLPIGRSPHDTIITADKRFEVDGANAAKRFIETHGKMQEWDSHRLQLVWDSIALHATGSIAFHKESEVQACTHGIWADFQGPDRVRDGLLTWQEYDIVLKEYPRLELMRGFKENMLHLCRTKPKTTYDNTVGEWGDRYLSMEEYDRKSNLNQAMLEICGDLDKRERESN